jgi:sulfur carrier protein ThiS
MASAVNGEFVARQDRHTHRLQDGDALLLFGAITGG